MSWFFLFLNKNMQLKTRIMDELENLKAAVIDFLAELETYNVDIPVKLWEQMDELEHLVKK